MESGQVIGCDVGGTFTDLVLMDPATGQVHIAKVPSTLDDQSRGVMNAVAEAEASLPGTALIVHGTTTTTNAVLERKLARTGIITTQGFRDVLELGRRTRPQAYGMKGDFKPLIPRDLRLEVPERMDAEGRVVTPLDENALRDAAKALLDLGCTAVVVHFLHAYRNPEHEIRAGEILKEIWPNPYVTLGHALLSESREYERGVTAAVNASVQPILDRYVQNLAGSLESGGYAGELLVMNGNGGMVSARRVAEEAARTVMSGPASGVMAAAFTGRAAGIPDLLTYDMGGTSTDVALIRNAATRCLERDRGGICHADPRADGRRAHRGRRRRLHRTGQCGGPLGGRTRIGRRHPPARSAMAGAARNPRFRMPTCCSDGSTLRG